MKKAVLTISLFLLSLTGFAQSYHNQFDTYIEGSKVLGPKMEKVSCAIEDLTHLVISTNNIDDQRRYAEGVYKLAKNLRLQIRDSMKAATKHRAAKIMLNMTINIVAFCVMAVLTDGGHGSANTMGAASSRDSELPACKYYDYMRAIQDDALTMKVASKEKNVLQAAYSILQSISDFNQYYAEGDIG